MRRNPSEAIYLAKGLGQDTSLFYPEALDSTQSPLIDYCRDSLLEISNKLRERKLLQNTAAKK